MPSARFTLSAFGDEIADDLAEQLQLLRDLGVGLDLRGAWGKNVLRFTDEDVARVAQLCADYGVTVHCIGSPIGKSPLKDPIQNELGNLERIVRIAEGVGTRRVRIFSFYPPDTHTNAHYDQHVEEAAERLSKLAAMAEQEDFMLLHENEKEIVGDTPERCAALLRAVDSPRLRLIWDPANFVQVGVAEQVTRYWTLLGPYVAYIHIKDALLADGSVRAAGEGDGQVKDLLIRLRDSGYQGILSLEPHLAVAGPSGGFSGAEKMTYAVHALRRLLDEIGAPAQP